MKENDFKAYSACSSFKCAQPLQHKQVETPHLQQSPILAWINSQEISITFEIIYSKLKDYPLIGSRFHHHQMYTKHTLLNKTNDKRKFQKPCASLWLIKSESTFTFPNFTSVPPLIYCDYLMTHPKVKVSKPNSVSKHTLLSTQYLFLNWSKSSSWVTSSLWR